MNLNQWAIKWGVPFEAVEDLRRQMTDLPTDPAPQGGESEAAVQSRIRLEASAKGARLWRNNRGAFTDERGNFVRYGLANDTSALDKQIKSHDLIGIRPVLILPEHVGNVIGQFVSREVKPAHWRWTGTAREVAQLRWAEMILGFGGDACFANGEGTL